MNTSFLSLPGHAQGAVASWQGWLPTPMLNAHPPSLPLVRDNCVWILHRYPELPWIQTVKPTSLPSTPP